VIVEAGETSGTLSQGWEALRLGRELFLLRSIVETPGLTWPQEMVGYGARVLTRTEELLDTLPPLLEDSLAAAAF
jgi:DNA processing protein